MSTDCDQQQLRVAKIDVQFKTVTYATVSAPFFMPVECPSSQREIHKCTLAVFVQGKLELEPKLVFLTVHDVGSTANSFIEFVNSPQMSPIRERAVFLHVCVPGQEPDAPDYMGEYPTMEQIGGMLPQVLDHFGLDKCIALGEGAGADIVCRFAMHFPRRVAGMVLIHCTSTPHGIVENLREIFANFRLDDGQMGNGAWGYLLTHRFGNHEHKSKHQFLEEIRAELNLRNLSRFLFSFHNRSDFTDSLKERLANVDTILVTGGQSSHNKNITHMYDNMSKEKTALLLAENASDVLREAPEYIVQAVILLCQRHASHEKKNTAISLLTEQIEDALKGMETKSRGTPLAVENGKAVATAQMDEPPASEETEAAAEQVLLPGNKCSASTISVGQGSCRSNFQCTHCGHQCGYCSTDAHFASPLD